MKALHFYLVLGLLILTLNSIRATATDTQGIPVSSQIEILDSSWSDKNISEVTSAKTWVPAYSDEGKSRLVFQGNWYRLTFGDWFQGQGDWILVHPLSAGFKLFRSKAGVTDAIDHGYKSNSPDRIHYRRTAVSLHSVQNGETIYFKVTGKPARSSDHPLLITPSAFITQVSQELPFSVFYYSVILVVSIIALFAFFMLREKIFLFYALYMLSTIGVFLGIQGYSYQYTTHWSPGISIFFFGIVNLFIIIFINELFKLKSKSLQLGSTAMAVVSFGFAIFSLLGHAATAFEGLYTVVIGTQLSVVGLCLYHAMKQKSDRWLLVAIALSFFVSSLGLINDKIWIPFTDLIDDAFQPVSLIEIVLFAFVLLRRFYYINQEKKEAVKLAQEKTLEALKLAAEKEKLRADAEIGATASQTAHDLASPLSSLNMLMKQIDAIPEDKRVLMRHSINRINDIIQTLSLKGKKVKGLEGNKDQQELTLLASLIASIVSEKRIQLRANGNVDLNATLENAYGLFAKVNPVELKRAISNAINNSVDAFGSANGTIEVTLTSNSDNVVLTIKDNGKGIPPEVLAKLGARGVTFGKEDHTVSGSGLGVYHARKTIESFGGEYKIESEVGNGTSVIIKLKKETPPQWFVQQLKLNVGSTVVAVDDDPSVLEIWNQRLSDFTKTGKINLYRCKTGQCLKDWIANHVTEATYLIDYEFLQQNYTGLDLMEQLGLKEKAILVSSRYEEPSILERCQKLGIKAIPKSMAGFVPIIVDDNKSIELDGVVIDDDPLIKMVWEFSAKDKNKNVLCFVNEDEFKASATSIPLTTPVYIDVNLGNGVIGQDVASRINNMGYTNINLATGYQAEDVVRPAFIKSVVSKDFPFA